MSNENKPPNKTAIEVLWKEMLAIDDSLKFNSETRMKLEERLREEEGHSAELKARRVELGLTVELLRKMEES